MANSLVSGSTRKSLAHCNSILLMVWANLRVPSSAATALGNSIFPLTAIKNAGLASKNLIQAKGPSWVTERETVCINLPTAWSTPAASLGVTEWEWRAPAPQGRQVAKVIAINKQRVEANIQTSVAGTLLSTTSDTIIGSPIRFTNFPLECRFVGRANGAGSGNEARPL